MRMYMHMIVASFEDATDPARAVTCGDGPGVFPMQRVLVCASWQRAPVRYGPHRLS